MSITLYQIMAQKKNQIKNPFIEKLNKNTFNPMNQLFKDKSLSPFRMDQTNTPTSQDTQNINHTNTFTSPITPRIPQSIITMQQIINMNSRTQPPPTQLPQPQPNTYNQKINITVKINQQLCILQQTQPISTLNQLKFENISAVIPANLSLEINARLQLTAKMANCLSSLFQIIRDNNSCILDNITQAIDRNIELKQIRLRYDQINRLMQGLYFYHPIHNSIIQQLQRSIKNYQLGSLVKSVSKHYKLDCLKAYYVVRQVHLAHRKIQKSSCFLAKIQPHNVLPQNQVLRAAFEFLQTDKKHLMACYKKYLSMYRKPSQMQVCSAMDQITILWSNVVLMDRQSAQIQWDIFDLYSRYRSLINEQQKIKKMHLKSIRDKMLGMKLDEQVMAKMYSVGADDGLRNGQMKQQNFKGPYLDLYQFLINKQQIDYETALKGLTKIQTLPPIWIDYFQKYVSQITFKINRDGSLLKGIYIYCIMNHLKDSCNGLSKTAKQKLIKSICKQVSLLLALIYSQFINDKQTNLWLLQILRRKNQDQLNIIQKADHQVIINYIQHYRNDSIVDMALKIVQLTFKQYLQSNDLQTIERQLSSGKINNFESQQHHLHCIQYYANLFKNIPSRQSKIQSLIHELFNSLTSRAYPISKSVSYYNSRMIGLAIPSSIINRHMIFLLTANIPQQHQQSYLIRWIDKIYSQIQKIDMSQHLEFICEVAQNFVKTNNSNFMSILIDCLTRLHNFILNYVHSVITHQTNYPVSIFRLFYTIERVIECNHILNSSPSQLILQLRDKLKQILRRRSNSALQLMDQHPQMNVAIKTIIFCDLMRDTLTKNKQYQQQTQFLISSWIDNRQKQINKRQFYQQITQQIDRLDDVSVIAFFYCTAKYQTDLFQIMIKQKFIRLVNVLQKSLSLSNIQKHKILFITIKIIKVLSSNSSQLIRNKQRNFVNLAISKILSLCLYQNIPFPTYSLLVDILLASLNQLQYNIHIICLQKGAKMNYFRVYQSTLSPSFGQYCLYLLCLQISK